MRVYRLQVRGVALLCILIFHTAVASPVVRRDVLAALAEDLDDLEPQPSDVVSQHRLETLSEEEIFGGHREEDGGGGGREKRLIKLKSLGLGAGLKTVGLLGAKAAGKALSSVAIKIAKAAVTIGIAKLLLTLVFGKINQVIDLKTRLLNNQGLLGVSSLSSGSQQPQQPDTPDGTPTTDQEEDLPDIDPEKVALQVPDQVITSGFNVVNRAAPIVGTVIQNTAERIARLIETLKPALRSSTLGSSASVSTKREARLPESEPSSPLKSSYVALAGN